MTVGPCNETLWHASPRRGSSTTGWPTLIVRTTCGSSCPDRTGRNVAIDIPERQAVPERLDAARMAVVHHGADAALAELRTKRGGALPLWFLLDRWWLATL